MAGINIQKMRPAEVARLVNSTALGFGMEQKRIYREFGIRFVCRMRGSFRNSHFPTRLVC